jgi:hypothetical protein
MILRNVYAYNRKEANLPLLKCQTFTDIGLELRKTCSMRVFQFRYQALLTKDIERVK